MRLLLIAFIALLAFPVHADPPPMKHHQYHPFWLRKQTGCCGPEDCFRVRVVRVAKGWLVTHRRLTPVVPWEKLTTPLLIEFTDTRVGASEDEIFWVCMYNYTDEMTGARKLNFYCAFPPIKV